MKAIYIVLLLIFTGNLLASGDQQKIYLFYTNDMRGGIEKQHATYMNPNFPPVLGGGAAVQGILKKYRKLADANGDIVLLLDAGSVFSGATQLGLESKGQAIIEYMNFVGYDAMVPGNRDFDAGAPALTKMAETASFPILAANLFDQNTKQQSAPIKPYTIINKGGLKIGLFGIISKSAEQADDLSNVEGIHFSSEIKAAKKAVASLEKEGVDLIIALTHLGLPYDSQVEYETLKEEERQNIAKNSYVTTMEFARFVPGIDILISGGMNRGYQQPWEDPVNHTLCFQNYANGGNLGLSEIQIDRSLKKISGYKLPSKEQGLLLLSEDEYWPDAESAAVIGKLQSEYSPNFDDVIGVTRTTLNRSSRGESPMSNMMCDAMLEAVNVDFAFNNFSGMRSDLAIGPITKRKLASVFPFGNEIVLIEVSGELLKELVEVSVVGSFGGLAIAGGSVVQDNSMPDGNRIVEFHVGGEPVKPEKKYKIATTNYLAEGNAGMTKLAFLSEDKFTFTDIKISDAVAEFVKKYSPLSVEPDGRWKKR